MNVNAIFNVIMNVMMDGMMDAMMNVIVNVMMNVIVNTKMAILLPYGLKGVPYSNRVKHRH